MQNLQYPYLTWVCGIALILDALKSMAYRMPQAGILYLSPKPQSTNRGPYTTLSPRAGAWLTPLRFEDFKYGRQVCEHMRAVLIVKDFLGSFRKNTLTVYRKRDSLSG